MQHLFDNIQLVYHVLLVQITKNMLAS